jgi:pimeloyl-ACP methyl ester carboxylesterase
VSTTTLERAATGAPVAFTCEGSRLVGSLHQPAQPVPGLPGIILLNQGPVDRGGAHRLYLKLAWRLTALGFPVLRFDARGVGESEGLWEGEQTSISVLDTYGAIQKGVWVPDTRAAIEFMQRATGVDKVILGGLCGGAATALLTGVNHPAVESMFVIGTPVTFTAVTRRVADLPEAIIQRDSRQYLRKLVDPKSWVRFLSFKTDYRTLLGVFTTQVQRRLKPSAASAEAPEADEKMNLPLLEAITGSTTQAKRLLMVFSENDYLWQEFQEQMWRFGDRDRLPFDLVTIPDANHTLTEEPWQDALYKEVTAWLDRSSTSQTSRRRSA